MNFETSEKDDTRRNWIRKEQIIDDSCHGGYCNE